MVGAEAMSEFKFACPVCGQHLTADSSTSGGQIVCPTCFQKIVVPQAPTSADTKLIVSAAQVAKPRPASPDAAPSLAPMQPSSRRNSIPALIALLVVLGAAGAAVFHFRDPLLAALRRLAPAGTNTVVSQPAAPAPLNPTHPIPTNFSWTLELTNAAIPDTPVAGEIHGRGFACEKAVLHGGLLLFGQGTAPAWDLGFGVDLVARQSEELSGRTIEIAPDQTNAPRVGWRWKNDQQQPATQIISNGYLLKVAFGQAAKGYLPGKIYICLPDADKSFAAGTFDAEIKKPPQAKPGPPKPPKPRK
jgi:DNA-directed RNA polymerase subunit RPC12/RpoP